MWERRSLFHIPMSHAQDRLPLSLKHPFFYETFDITLFRVSEAPEGAEDGCAGHTELFGWPQVGRFVSLREHRWIYGRGADGSGAVGDSVDLVNRR